MDGKANIKISGKTQVSADSELLIMAFQELFQDSLNYYSGPELSSVVVGIKKYRNSSLVISYADNGPGVKPENKVRIFDPLFSASSKQGGIKSTGVGLYFVKNVLEGHGWTISEVGKCGEGVLFRITIPSSVGWK